VRAIAAILALGLSAASAATVELVKDEAKHHLSVLIGGKLAVAYNYGPDHFLPYFYPVNSPSGKLLTVELTKPYPHHRSFWFADRVQLDGRRPVHFYHAYYDFLKGRRDRIRHDRFLEQKVEGDTARLGMRLLWEMDDGTPVLEETRHLAIRPLGDGEWFMDIRFTVTAAFGDVRFVSDAVHYAWPYLRMHPRFSVKQGGRLVNSEGGINQKGTNGKVAKWCDYWNAVDGATEGLAIFSHPENEHPHRWLTRDYGCFGPRRPDAKSGKPFTLKKGDSLTMRVGILVHKGDTKTGKVAERYRLYSEGSLALLPKLDVDK